MKKNPIYTTKNTKNSMKKLAFFVALVPVLASCNTEKIQVKTAENNVITIENKHDAIIKKGDSLVIENYIYENDWNIVPTFKNDTHFLEYKKVVVTEVQN